MVPSFKFRILDEILYSYHVLVMTKGSKLKTFMDSFV